MSTENNENAGMATILEMKRAETNESEDATLAMEIKAELEAIELDSPEMDYIATHIGYIMMGFMGVMYRTDLSGLSYFLRKYIDHKSEENSPLYRDFAKWLKFVTAKSSLDEDDEFPQDLLQLCDRMVARNSARRIFGDSVQD